jgi:hypothetical protein
MSTVDAVRLIGLTHALQPPLTLLLASERGLGLRAAIATRNRLAAAVVHNMAIAAVALPTTLGLLLAYHGGDVLDAGAARTLALLLALFWSWRLARQLTALRLEWPRGRSLDVWLERCLIGIFVLQGPVLGCLVLAGHSK